MAITALLFIVTQSVMEQYDALPLDPDAATAVQTFLSNASVADNNTVFTVGGLTFGQFIQIDVANQWAATEDALWTKIEAKMNKTLTKPTGPGVTWGPNETLLNIAVNIGMQ